MGCDGKQLGPRRLSLCGPILTLLRWRRSVLGRSGSFTRNTVTGSAAGCSSRRATRRRKTRHSSEARRREGALLHFGLDDIAQLVIVAQELGGAIAPLAEANLTFRRVFERIPSSHLWMTPIVAATSRSSPHDRFRGRGACRPPPFGTAARSCSSPQKRACAIRMTLSPSLMVWTRRTSKRTLE